MARMIALKEEDDGALSVHIPHYNADYATLCGIDNGLADDASGVSSDTQQLPKGAKITCKRCWRIWRQTRNIRASDFAENIDF